jgi:dephospho-CoA kinase
MPHLLGLTGNIACGKTTIGQMLLALGAARYIDADAVVHDLYRPGEAIYVAVRQAFGPEILTPQGEIDRKKLGDRVFNDAAALKQLEAITHPAVTVAVATQLAEVSPAAIVIVDAVKLLEGGTAKLCDAVWLVTCAVEEERRRLIVDRGMTAAEAEARLAAQPNNDARRALVDVVIDNSGTLEATHAQVLAAWEGFRAKLG